MDTIIRSTLLVWLCLQMASADVDWMQKCGLCHCKWNSGKKTADCTKQSFLAIPTEMSGELQVLDLSQNQIAELRRDEFKDAYLENLHKIFMKNCTLQEINRDALRSLQVLIELDFSNNLIRVLHSGTFTGLVKLRTIILNNNEIETLDDYLFENLLFLFKIEIKNNRLHQVGLRTFIGVPKLSQIIFDSNHLSVLKEETFRNLDNMKSLSLSDNPWNCTCELQQFQKFVINNKLYTPPTSCAEPQHLKGKLWSDVAPESFACKPKIIFPESYANGTYNILTAANKNATLMCRMKGSPKPDIFWLYNKRPINNNDQRIHIKNSQEVNQRDSLDVYTSELIIIGVKVSDKGSYICSASNKGGKEEVEINLLIPLNTMEKEEFVTSSTNSLLLIFLITIILLSLLIIVFLVLFCYCRRIKKYSKNGSISENGLMSSSKLDKSQTVSGMNGNGDSMLEGSVIMEMQKSLLTEVNPVVKPPRRTDMTDSTGDLIDDGHEMKKTLLDETNFGNQDDETHSISLSDTTPRSRTTFIDDGYGTNLPPDLLAFPTRFTQSPSLQSSMSNIQDGRIYVKSPVASPIYQHNPNIYSTGPNSGFRTLQHPRSGRNNNMTVINRSQSPFTPAPIMYTPVVGLKQGYVTIPRKPRTPSWAPSLSSNLTDYAPTSPTSTMSTEIVEPVYDNLGLRTTASGNSVLNINKIGQQTPSSQSNTLNKYSMKDRPLPATPRAYEVIQENGMGANNSAAAYPNGDLSMSTNDTEALYSKSNKTPLIVNGGGSTCNTMEKVAKIPPRPPPKPKKKKNSSLNGDTSSSQLFEDECEDGTEV